MTVGICLLELHLLDKPQNIKEKRRIVRQIKDKLKNSFPLSVAEVGNQDLYHLFTLGMATVAAEQKDAQAVLQKALNYLDSNPGIEIIHQLLEFERYKR